MLTCQLSKDHIDKCVVVAYVGLDFSSSDPCKLKGET